MTSSLVSAALLRNLGYKQSLDQDAPINNGVSDLYPKLQLAMGDLHGALIALDGSKFKAVNSHERNFTRAKLAQQMAKVEASIAGYLEALDDGDRTNDETTPS
jgi:hypothetical protein